jgi:ribosome-associated translation inhibitor RaiA
VSTLLFNDVPDSTTSKTTNDGHYLQQADTTPRFHADDIDIFGRILEAIGDAYLALDAVTAKVRLKINKQKTKYMIAARGGRYMTQK